MVRKAKQQLPTETIMPPSTSQAVPEVPAKAAPPQIKKPANRSGFMLVVAAAVTLAGLFVGYLWFTLFSSNMGVGIVAIAGIAGGGYLFRRTWRKAADAGTVIVTDKPVPKKQVNCMNLYPDRGVIFEDMATPQGQPWECLNDSKSYFVHEWNALTKRLEPFTLPDQQYYDPGVFAERVLELPAHRRIFRRKEKLFEQLKPFVLMLVIGIIWMLIITTTTPGGQ